MYSKSISKGKVIAIQSYLKRQEKSQISNLTLHLNQLEKEEQNLKLAEGNKSENQSRNKWNRNEDTIAKVNETKSWFFQKISKIDKTLEQDSWSKKGEDSNQ